ncbi:hypothetical protein D3C81_1685080 [compost metagenome]
MQHFHRHAGSAQAHAVVQAIVADRVESGGDDHRRRQAAQVGAAARGIPGIFEIQGIGGFAQLLFEPGNPLGGQEIAAVDVFLVGRELLHQFGGGIHHYLHTQRRAATA